jgi:hypothetical protein
MDWLFHQAKPQEKVVLRGKRIVYRRKLNLCGMRLSSGDLLIIATNADVNIALEIYAKRWEVETLFQCLKSRGFYFEEMHITNRAKIKKLIVLLAIAYCWAHKTGEWRIEQQEPILIKKHGRLAQSIFRYGLDLLQDALMKLVFTIRPIMKFCKMLQLPDYQLIEVVK